MEIAGETVTVRGMVDDPSAQIQLYAIANSNANPYYVFVSREGEFWSLDVGLSAGTNYLALVATDAAGHTTTLTNMVIRSDLQITVNTNTTQFSLLNQGLAGQVSGTISSNCPACQTNPAAWATNLTLWINGVKAQWTVDAYGNVLWLARVRTLKQGMGLFQFTTIPNSQNNGNGWGGSGLLTFTDTGNPYAPGSVQSGQTWEQPTIIYLASYTNSYTFHLPTNQTPQPPDEVMSMSWNNGIGGQAYVSGGRGQDCAQSWEWTAEGGVTNYEFTCGGFYTEGAFYAPTQTVALQANLEYQCPPWSLPGSYFTGHAQSALFIRVGGLPGQQTLVRLTANPKYYSFDDWGWDDYYTNAYGMMDVPIPPFTPWSATFEERGTIPAQLVSLLGQTLDANYDMAFTGMGGDNVYVPMVVLGGYANATNVIEADIAAAPTRLLIKRGGSNITDTVQTVIVGERITLTNELTGGSGPASSNLWTIQGKYIWDFNPYNTNFDQVITNAPRDYTNSGISFVYWDGGNNLEVHCTAEIPGTTNLTSAKVAFNVIKPTVDYFAINTNSVNVITNLAGIDSTNNWLIFGGGPTDSLGMIFIFTNFNVGGYRGPYSVYFVQTGTNYYETIDRFNLKDKLGGSGLDTSFPYSSNTNSPLADFAEDSPASELFTIYNYYFRTNSFKMYLMFRPQIPLSCPIPLGYIPWNWSGSATNTTNIAGHWQLLSGYPTNCMTLTNITTTVLTNAFPQWNDFINHMVPLP